MMAFESMWRKIRTIAVFTALEAVRSRFIFVLLTVLLAAFLVAEIAGAASVTESGSVKLAFLAAPLRMAAVFLVALFVVSSIAREQADKGSELVLSLALPRHVYYFGKLLGHAMVALAIAVLCMSLIACYAPVQQAMLWGASLYCELIIIAAISLLCMFTFSQVPAALTAVAGFYLLARVMEAIRLMARGPLVDPNDRISTLIAHSIDGLAYALPDLYRYTPSEWLLYQTGTVTALGPLVLQTLIYIVLIAAAGLFDLYRRNF